MKKSLVLTLAVVFVLGIAGTAFAANPFVDVPANHWAYASVSKLAAAGIIAGYGDGTFVGASTMTRYEMAQIVAKAMARSDKTDAAMKAQIEKLAAEFASELDSLGVRVAKLEKNADDVKITGEVRFADYAYKNNTSEDNDTLRTRLWITGQVNDRWTYGGMIEHDGQNLRTNSNYDAAVSLRQAWVEGKVGDVGVTAGRFNYAPVYGLILDDDGDGIKLDYAKGNWHLDLFALRPSIANAWYDPANFAGSGKAQVYGAVLGYDFHEKLNAQVAWYNIDATDASAYASAANVFEAAIGYTFNDKWSVWAEYLHGDDPADVGLSKNGWAARVDYGEIDREKPGTWGLRAGYYDVPAGAPLTTTVDLDITSTGFGYKGYQLGATYVVAKNIDINFDYYDFKGKEDNSFKEKLYFSYVQFYF